MVPPPMYWLSYRGLLFTPNYSLRLCTEYKIIDSESHSNITDKTDLLLFTNTLCRLWLHHMRANQPAVVETLRIESSPDCSCSTTIIYSKQCVMQRFQQTLIKQLHVLSLSILDGFSERELTFTFAIIYRPSVCRLSSVCNARAPYSGGSNFRQYFYGIRYLGHPLTFAENFTEIVPGNPSAGGVKHKRGSQE